MPSSMWRPRVVSCQCTSVWGSSANQSRRSPTDQIPDLLIQPPRFVELATSGLTVTTRSATSGASCTRSTKKRPNACWVDSWPRCLRPSVGGTSGGSRAARARRARARRGRGAQLGLGAARRRSCAQGSSASAPSCSRELRELLGGQQRRVVLRVALDRQRPALDRVGEDHRRPVVLDRRGRPRSACRGRGRRGRGRPRAARRRRARRRAAASSRRRPGSRSRSVAGLGAQQPLVLLVGHLVDAPAQLLAAGPPNSASRSRRPYLTVMHLPAGRLEHPGQPAERRCRARRGRATAG